jgi:hypothetical protein
MKSRKPARRKSVQTKALTFMPAVSGWEFFNGKLPGSDINYAEAVKNGMHSSVVTSALCWMMRTFPEAPIVVQRLKEEKWEVQAQHDMALLLEQPNPYYSGIVVGTESADQTDARLKNWAPVLLPVQPRIGR